MFSYNVFGFAFIFTFSVVQSGNILKMIMGKSMEEIYREETQDLIMKRCKDACNLEYRFLPHIACGDIPMTKMLLEAGVDPNAGNSVLKPLHIATFYTEINSSYPGCQIVDLLISFHADVDVKNKNGKTALDIIRKEGAISKKLIEAGAWISNPKSVLTSLESFGVSKSALHDAKTYQSFDEYVFNVTNDYLFQLEFGFDDTPDHFTNGKSLLDYFENSLTYVLYRISKRIYAKPSSEGCSVFESEKFVVFDHCLSEISKRTYLETVPLDLFQDVLFSINFGWRVDSLAWNAVLTSTKYFANIEQVKKFALETLIEKYY